MDTEYCDKIEKGVIIRENDLERLGLKDTGDRLGFPRLQIYRCESDRKIHKVALLPIEKVYKVCIVYKNIWLVGLAIKMGVNWTIYTRRREQKRRISKKNNIIF